MKQLQELYQRILDQGVESVDRTGVGTIKLIGQQMRFDL
ncbi:thymidylate synthase, partial [Escherichia coli]